MKFFVDECLPARFAAGLRAAGHDAVHVSEVGLLGAPDEDVLAAAENGRRVLLSADTDFGELLATGKAVAPSLVLFRGQPSPARRLDVLLANLEQFAEELEAGAVVVIGDERIRIRLLPLR